MKEIDVYRFLGRNIRHHRKRCSMTQEELGRLVPLTRTSIVNIEAGRQRIQAHTIVFISEALGVTPGILFKKP